jgi:hypothetical protein
MAEPMKVSENVKVFRDGNSGLRVSLVLLQPVESNRALIEVTGSDTVLDKLVRLHEREESGRGHGWHSKLKGGSWYTLRFETDRWSNFEQPWAWIPGRRDGIPLAFDQEASDKAKGDDLLNRHLRQAQEGVLDKLAAFDRQEKLAEQRKGFEEYVKAADEACGTHFEATVEWDGIDDEGLRTYSVGSYFGAPLDALRRLGGRSELEYLKPAIRQIKKVSARLGKRPTLTLAGGEVKFTTAWDASNIDDFAFYTLLNLLNQQVA